MPGTMERLDDDVPDLTATLWVRVSDSQWLASISSPPLYLSAYQHIILSKVSDYVNINSVGCGRKSDSCEAVLSTA
jgi:hypothetical protein